MTSREQLLATTFRELADTLIADFDVVGFLGTLATRSVRLLDVDAAGIMLVEPDGGLRVLASSAEEAHLLGLYELQNDEGPGPECFRTGRPVMRDGLPAMSASWPAFTRELQGLGFRSAEALPLRRRDETIGVLNLFRIGPGRLSATDLGMGQAMADVATVGLMQKRAIAAGELLINQLRTALNSRIQVEQAKGVLSQRAGLSMDEAFQVMRAYARGHNRRLADVATQIIDGRLPPS